MTQNRVFYDYRKYGDRTLGVWLLRNIFVFTTYDLVSRNKNMDKNIIKLNSELEGRWYYLQYSYSGVKKLAVGIVSEGSE